jgi:hypothetical protein
MNETEGIDERPARIPSVTRAAHSRHEPCDREEGNQPDRQQAQSSVKRLPPSRDQPGLHNQQQNPSREAGGMDMNDRRE